MPTEMRKYYRARAIDCARRLVRFLEIDDMPMVIVARELARLEDRVRMMDPHHYALACGSYEEERIKRHGGWCTMPECEERAGDSVKVDNIVIKYFCAEHAQVIAKDIRESIYSFDEIDIEDLS